MAKSPIMRIPRHSSPSGVTFKSDGLEKSKRPSSSMSRRSRARKAARQSQKRVNPYTSHQLAVSTIQSPYLRRVTYTPYKTRPNPRPPAPRPGVPQNRRLRRLNNLQRNLHRLDPNFYLARLDPLRPVRLAARKVRICVTRRIRREIMFAINHGGGKGAKRSHHRTEDSKIKC